MSPPTRLTVTTPRPGRQSRVATQPPRRPPQPAQEEKDPALGTSLASHRQPGQPRVQNKKGDRHHETLPSPPYRPFVRSHRRQVVSKGVHGSVSLSLSQFPKPNFVAVMEFLGGGEIKWRDSNSNPVLRVDQSRRICRDVILGLEYRPSCLFLCAPSPSRSTLTVSPL